MITAITAQNTRAVTAVHDVPVPVIAAQIEAVFDDIAVDAVKIGMLSSPPIIGAVAEALTGGGVPVVLDPVMVAKSGDALLQDEAVDTIRAVLVSQASVLTPNLPEAARLLDAPEAHDERSMVDQGRALLALGANAVLMKGGHARGDRCVDLLICADGAVLRMQAPRHPTPNTHGTGCTLSAAIAAGLARGLALHAAVESAHAYLQRAIRAADSLHIGSGHGPVHHFHAAWPKLDFSVPA